MHYITQKVHNFRLLLSNKHEYVLLFHCTLKELKEHLPSLLENQKQTFACWQVYNARH